MKLQAGKLVWLDGQVARDSLSINFMNGHKAFEGFILTPKNLVENSKNGLIPAISYSREQVARKVQWRQPDSPSQSLICEAPVTNMYCVSNGGHFKSEDIINKKDSLTRAQLSSSECIQFCKASQKKFTMVWQEKASETSCNCFDEPSHQETLYEWEISQPGQCNPNCEGQYCGQLTKEVQSYAVFNNSLYPFPFGTCEQLHMRNHYPIGSPPHLLPLQKHPSASSPASDHQIDCSYEDPIVCQAPLLLLKEKSVKVKVDGKNVDLSTNPIFRRWEFPDPSPEAGSNMDISITFREMTIIRAFYTSWTVSKCSFSQQPTGDLEVVKYSNMTQWMKTVQESEAAKGPFSFLLPFALLAQRIHCTLSLSEGQFVPFFELRGCQSSNNANPPAIKAGGKAFKIVKPEDGSPSASFYGSLEKQCKTLGGTLAVPENKEKSDAIKAFAKLSRNASSLLIGLRREELVWRFPGGRPLGTFQDWKSG